MMEIAERMRSGYERHDFARHQCSKLMSRDVGLIGLLRYLPLAQFTKARPVDSLGPFSLASLKTGFFMAPDCQRPVVIPRIQTTQGCTRVPVSLRVPRALRGY